MKRILTAVAAACALTLGVSAAAFTDIQNEEVARAADALNSLGIMQGVGGSSFSPDSPLTRAEFCKLAVLTLGTTDVSGYQNYTIFPDVRNTHWASGYINSAVKSHNIIKGFPDGTFQPDRPLSYGEACTMFLSMLGYKLEDVGPFWPNDFITKAESLHIADGVTITGGDTVVTRGQAAIMLRNLLTTNRKEGEGSSNNGSILLRTSFPNLSENNILLATSETDTDLSNGQVRFYQNDDNETKEYFSIGSIGDSLIGAKGYIIFDNVQKSKVLGFLPENQAAETMTIKKSYVDKLETKEGTLKPVSTTAVILSGKRTDYSRAWVDMVPDQKIIVYYDESGTINIIAVASHLTNSGSFVYGTSGSLGIPDGYTLTKNGAPASLTDLKKFDVVTISSSGKTVTATDKRITGYYTNGEPSFGYPATVTLLGKEYKIPENAKSYFKDMKYNDKITLLMDAYGEVAAAYRAETVTSDMLGVMTALDGQKATVSMLNGLTLDLIIENSEESLSNLAGKLVQVGPYKTGGAYLMAANLPPKAYGNWDLQAGLVGNTSVLPNVQIYEMVSEEAPLNEIEMEDIEQKVVQIEDIVSTITDSSGRIRAIVLGDVTGESYDYGIASAYGEKVVSPGLTDDYPDITNYKNYVKLQSSDNTTRNYAVWEATGVERTPVGIPKGMEKFKARVHMPIKKLTLIDTVSVEKFDGSNGVRTSQGYFQLGSDINVYIKDYDRFVPLSEAKANFKRFRLYADKSLNDGGKIRLIYAESLKGDDED